MLNFVFPERKLLSDYRGVIDDKAYSEIEQLAQGLIGKRILHVNATATGGGVAELLKAVVPLANSIGVTSDWCVINGSPGFFDVSKTMHNSLQGDPSPWTQDMWETWFHCNEINAKELNPAEYDYIVIHDPQPAGILMFLKQASPQVHGKWIWRCHIDLTNAEDHVWDTIRPCIELFDAAIFTLEEFVRNNLEHPKIHISAPGIDPLSPKNLPLNSEQARNILISNNIDPQRPIISQISRLDPWKDPLGVVDTYRLVKAQRPDVQLVLVSVMAPDDPEGWIYYEKTLRHAGEDPDIHFLTDRFSQGNEDVVNAIQTASDVIIQKSIREGFGLTVTEALWKGKPVVAGNAGGIRLQVINEATGFLINSTEECADRVLYLLEHKEEATRLGESAREHVRNSFLVTRYLRDYLELFNSFENGR